MMRTRKVTNILSDKSHHSISSKGFTLIDFVVLQRLQHRAIGTTPDLHRHRQVSPRSLLTVSIVSQFPISLCPHSNLRSDFFSLLPKAGEWGMPSRALRERQGSSGSATAPRSTAPHGQSPSLIWLRQPRAQARACTGCSPRTIRRSTRTRTRRNDPR